MRSPWLTLGRLFALTTFIIALAASASFLVFYQSSERSIVQRSEQQRERAALQVQLEVSSELDAAAQALADLENAIRSEALDPGDFRSGEAWLFSELLDHPTVSDISLTHAIQLGYGADGAAVLAPNDRWQVSVFRTSASPESPIVTRRTFPEGAGFASEVRQREAEGALSSGVLRREPKGTDPTAHPTFSTTISREFHGKPIWSDLSYSELDSALPQAERRVVVTVQKAVHDSAGRFVGVLRVGLLTRTIDALPRSWTRGSERIILCDAEGRLVARLDPADRLELMGDDLRVVASNTPPDVAVALEHAGRSGAARVGGANYLVTFRELPHTQHWLVGVIAPEALYTQDLRRLRDLFVLGFSVVTAMVLAVGWFLLRAIRGSLARVLATTDRMRRLDFTASPVAAPLREVAAVMDGIERAKTSVRALGKYVPIDLMRELYSANREPELGGELIDLSLMFTDIEGFTTLSERLQPAELARALGCYLDAMTRAVRSTGGTVDKFIGDAVMAFWNAPRPLDDHARRACRAVLECRRTTRALYTSEAWHGLPALITRFGVHTARVMVGHFGAPDRISYTALGDGVNLASRLEGLGKQYGLAVLVSESTVHAVDGDFAFRLVDKVAVKGKHEAVRIYELLGEPHECEARLPVVRAYERALEAYFARDFGQALEQFEAIADDPPSGVLAERCRAMMAHPPGEDWDGVYVATSK
jgi:adenylate cyclase